MEKEQFKGSAKDTAGKVQRKTGEMLGSEEQQAKGAARQAEGKTQKAAGKVREKFQK